MKKTDKLFELIKSMSVSEKVYLKKYTSIHIKSDQKDYLHLFNAMSSLKEYDESKLKKILKGSYSSRYLSASKAYLYKLILRCLRIYHSDETPATKTQELLLDSMFLNDRGLLKQSNQHLEQAKDVAIQKEDLISLLKISELQQENLLKDLDDKEFKVRGEMLCTLMIELTDKIKEKTEIFNLQMNAHLLHRKYGQSSTNKNATSESLKTLQNPLLGAERKYYTRETFYRSLLIKSCLNNILGNYEAVSEINSQHLSALKKDPLFNTEPLNYQYGLMLVNRICVCSILERFKEAEAAFKEICSLKITSLQREQTLFIFTYANITSLFIHSKNTEKGLALIPRITSYLKKYEAELPMEPLVGLFLHIAVLYFMAGDYSNSLKWINKSLSIVKRNVREDSYINIGILNILVHYELKNFQLAASLIISLRRFISKVKRADNMAKVIMDHMKNLLYLQDKQEIQEGFIQLKNKIIETPIEDKGVKNYLLIWVEKHIKN